VVSGLVAVRAGVFDLSDVPNSEVLEPGFHEYQVLGELERRYQLASLPGKALVTVFDSHGRMALLDDAIVRAQVTGENINNALIDARRYRDRSGISVNIQQHLTDDLGRSRALARPAVMLRYMNSPIRTSRSRRAFR